MKALWKAKVFAAEEMWEHLQRSLLSLRLKWIWKCR